jgi:hypothetical protein
MGNVTLEEALQLVTLYCEQADPRAERAMVRWLGRLFSEKRMEFALAAQGVELVRELRERDACWRHPSVWPSSGPEAERTASALGALCGADPKGSGAL